MQLRRKGALVAAVVVTAVAVPAAPASASGPKDPVRCAKEGAAALAHYLIDGRPIEPVACY